MNPVARFESFIERLMERTFTRATRSHLQPVEIGKRLVRAMESDQSVGVEGILVPNVYDVYLSPVDYDHFLPMRQSITEKLEAHVARMARQRRFQFVSQPQVNLRRRERLDRGDVAVEAYSQDVQTQQPNLQHTSVLPALNESQMFEPQPAGPAILYNDRSFAILRSPTSVGRLPENDIVLDDRRVSRHHAEFVRQQGRWVLRDTGSTNGTAVNGKVVRESPLRRGDVISLGGLEVTWEQ